MVTAEELLRMPEGQCRRELVRGVVREMPFRGALEGRVLACVMMYLGEYVKERRLGLVYSATGFHLEFDPDTVLSCPVGFVGRRRNGELGDSDGYVPGPPDLAIETVSWSSTPGEMEAKARDWLAAGCRMAVVIDPSLRTATVHHPGTGTLLLNEGDVLDGGDVVPGWRLPLRDVFR